MRNGIQMELLAATAETGFSLDELVFKLKELMHERGMGFIHNVRRIIDALPERRQSLFFSAMVAELWPGRSSGFFGREGGNPAGHRLVRSMRGKNSGRDAF